jgi:enoyl-CoA hydratase/carnithine racemase
MPVTGSNGRAELQVEDGVADVRLVDTERKNCFSIPMGEDLLELYTEIEETADVCAVSFTAAGDVFCAGLDLDIVSNPEERADDLEHMLDIFEPAREWLRHCPYPTVVGAHGVAPGAGAALANAADILVAGENLEIWWPEINVGIPPYTLGPRLLRQVGHRRATELTLLGREAKLSADEARELGLVNHVVPTDEVTAEAREVARDLADVHQRHGTVLDVYETIQAAGRRADGSDVLAGWKGERREWF